MTSERRRFESILGRYSIEVTPRDDEAYQAVAELLPPGSEVFIANLPHHEPEVLVGAAARVRKAGLHPVPHLVARNIRSEASFENLLSKLTGEARIDRAMILGGDRSEPVGPYREGLHLIETGLLQNYGIKSLAFACFPEGHPAIDERELRRALQAKVQAAARAGHDVLLVSQFVFEAQPVVDFAKRLREDRIFAPLRIGIAGPADPATLSEFASELGVGESMRVLEEPSGAAESDGADATIERLLHELAAAQAGEPSLLIEGIHLFAFGSTSDVIQWAQHHRE